MPRGKVKRVQVLVGTRKGAFVFTSDLRRRSWKVDGPHFAGQNVYHFISAGREGGPVLFAAVNNAWFGSDVPAMPGGIGASKGGGYPPVTPMCWFSGRRFPQTSTIRRDSISELKPDSCSTHLTKVASSDCSQTTCRLFLRLRRHSFETFNGISPRGNCPVPGAS